MRADDNGTVSVLIYPQIQLLINRNNLNAQLVQTPSLLRTFQMYQLQ